MANISYDTCGKFNYQMAQIGTGPGKGPGKGLFQLQGTKKTRYF
jgi:hypothetical protein